MRAKRFISLLLLLAVVLQLGVPSQVQALQITNNEHPIGMGVANVGLPNQVESPDTLSFEYAYLKQSVGLWADGKGDVLLEQWVTNTSSSPSDIFDRLTWYFEWPSATYTNISAKDSAGPLTVQQSISGNRIYLTVIFRRPVAQNSTYKFKLFLTIAGMAYGSGDNWSANWYTTGGANVKVFEEVLALPANANVTSIDPAANERHGNIISWKLENQSNWTLSIYVPYVLSNQINAPLFLQASQPWGDDLYAHNTLPADNMAKWGCLTTSGAMIVNYLSASQDRTYLTDPGVLNTWLKDNDGYTVDNGVKQAWIGKYARTEPHSISMYWNKYVGYSTDTLDYYLRSGYPVILGVKPTSVDNKIIPGHYVVATGKTTKNGQATYTINDPAYGETTLLDQWSNSALTMILFSASEANQQLLYFAAQSPIEFVVSDPLGRKSGYDPSTNTTWDEIPGAYYMYDGLGSIDGTSPPIYMKTLNIPDPLDGDYTIIVYGTGTGNFTMEVSSMDWQGTSENHLFTGNTTEGETHTYTITYSQVINVLYLPMVTR